MLQILRKVYRRLRGQPAAGFDSGAIDGFLDQDVQRLHTVDPNTNLQWERLRVALKAEPVAVRLRPAVRMVRRVRLATSFAATVVLLVVIGMLVFDRTPTVTYQTTKGQQTTITLPDSTEVTLNHTSELIVQGKFSRGPRQVTLRGEAFFHVRKTGGPFTVNTDIATVRVLGTAFNVRDRENRLEVAVISGSVNVGVRRNGRDSTLVLAKEQLTTCTKGGFPAAAVLLPFSEYPGWMHGRLVFHRASFQSVCEEIREQFDITIRAENSHLLGETLTGAVDVRNLDAALSTLARLTGTNYRYENNGYIFF